MLTCRVVACILVKDDWVVQSFGFKKYLPIGNLKTAVEFFSRWDADEIVILDISATPAGRKPNLDSVRRATQNCFVPITLGGGIREVSDIKAILRAGADKACINTQAIQNPDFISKAAAHFGSQCITVSMDVKRNDRGQYEVYSHGGTRSTGLNPRKWAEKIEGLGAGEIFLNSIDRDGSRLGYDIELLDHVSSAVKVPVIACGGVGSNLHFADGLKRGGCQALAAANIFLHTEHSIITAKSALKRAGVPVRQSTDAKYVGNLPDVLGRPVA